LFFFSVHAPPEFYTLSLHDALPIWLQSAVGRTLLSRGSRIFHHGPRARRFLTPNAPFGSKASGKRLYLFGAAADLPADAGKSAADRKSTRLNSSHLGISYAVFCLKK